MPDAPIPMPFALHLFGLFEVFVNGQSLSRPRARTGEWILALLALHQKRPVERSWLASLLWPDSSHEQALYNLRRNLTDLRQLLGSEADRLASPTPRTLHLNLDGAECDVLAFDALHQRTDSASLRSAVALYRGPLLEGCSEEWAIQERAVREQAYLSALETLAARAMQEGDSPVAVFHLKQVLAVDAYRETALQSLLHTLAAAGDIVGAILAYREFRLLLHRELHTEPTSETQALYRSLRRRIKEHSQPPFVRLPLESSIAPPLHLPQPLSGLVGRAEEMAQVQDCLERARLVTLTGAGGVGKTRLAIAVAGEMAGGFQEGIWFVDLTPLSEPALIPFAIASCLHLQEEPGLSSMETLTQHLAPKEILLVLDNCEHLAAEFASLAHTLLQSCPSLHILATSRQAFGLSGEVVRRVPSLAFPTEAESGEEKEEGEALTARLQHFDALRLFAERVRESSPSFTLHPRNMTLVARICRRLDGIPLAIELAAARTRFLSLEEIYARLRMNFRLLRGGIGTLPRQETLAATFAWSWSLLAPLERLLLERLSVFAGGWSLAAAEAVCAGNGLEESQVLDLLLALVDRSLVVYTPPKAQESGMESDKGEARYSLLETTRQFAAERLAENGESQAIHDRHRDHFLAWAEDVSPELWKAEQALWFERLETDHNNLRAALEWCRRQNAIEQEFRFVVALSRFWDTHGHLSEGYTHLETALARVTPELRPELHTDVLANAGWMAHTRGDNAASRLHCEQALAICRQIGYEAHQPGLLNFLACAYSDEGDFTKARILFEEANITCLRFNKPSHRAAMLNNLGRSLLRQGEIAAAQTCLEEGKALCKEIGANQLLGVTLHNLSIAALRQGHYEAALDHNASSLRVCHASRALINIPEALDLMAVLACRRTQWERAACLLGVAEGLRRMFGVPSEDALATDLVEAAAATRLVLGAQVFASQFTKGSTMNMEEAVSYALEAEKLSR